MPTFAEQQLTKIEALMDSVPPGVKTISVDGMSVSYDDLLKRRRDLKREVAREQGTRPRAAQIDLSGF